MIERVQLVLLEQEGGGVSRKISGLGTGQKVQGRGDWPEQRGGGSSVFEPFVRGGSSWFFL